MPSAGGISPPTIVTMKSSGVIPGNKIDTCTYIEITTESRGCKIFFTTDGTKPLPHGPAAGAKNTTHKYRAPFTMRAGNRVLKAMCINKHDQRESPVITRNYKIVEHSQDTSEVSFSDSDDYMMVERRKPRNIGKHKCNDQSSFDESVGLSKKVQISEQRGKSNLSQAQPSHEVPCKSINYSGTQINIWGSTPQSAIEELSRGFCVNKNQKMFGMNQSGNFNGYLTEEMLRRAENQQLLTVGDLKNAIRRYAPQIEAPREKLPIEYHQLSDPPVSSKSPGNGDWRGQLTHIYAHLTTRAKQDSEFMADLANAKFGEVVDAELVQTEGGYQLSVLLENAVKRPPVMKKPKIIQPAEKPKHIVETTNKPLTPTLQVIQPKKAVPKNVEPYYMTEDYEQAGTVVGVDDLNPEQDASILRKAMKGLGTDEKALINILCTRTNIQRQKIAAAFKSNFGRDLKEDIRGETSGNFRVVLLALLEEGVEYDARTLNRAVKGLGTDEDVLVEIICTRTSQQLEAIKAAYERMFKRTLEKDIVDDTSGDFRRIIVSLLQNTRETGETYDLNKVKEDVKALQKAGTDKWGTEESVFNKILANRSFAFLRAVFEEYLKQTGQQFEDVLKKEMSGDLLRACLAVVRCIADKPAFYAKKLSDAMKGLGTKDEALIRIVVSRCEVDLVQIKERFHTLTNKTLALAVKGETSGDYQASLLTLIGK